MSVFKYSHVFYFLSALGSNELENIKNQTSAVQDDLRCMKPKIFEQFAMMSKEFIYLQKTMNNIRHQLTELNPQTSRLRRDGSGATLSVDHSVDISSNGGSKSPLDDLDYSLRCTTVPRDVLLRDRNTSVESCGSSLAVNTDVTKLPCWLRRVKTKDVSERGSSLTVEPVKPDFMFTF